MTVSVAEQWKKHIPWVEIIDGQIIVKIWHVIEHPMMEQHYIMMVDILRLTQAWYISIKRVVLKPSDKPEVVLNSNDLEPGSYKVQAHCNIHGVWENEILI